MDPEQLNVYFIGPWWWLRVWGEWLSSLNISYEGYSFRDFLIDIICPDLLEAIA